MNEKLLSRKELASAMDRSPGYISAMSKIGFKPVLPGRYSLNEAFKFLRKHKGFRWSDAYRPGLQTNANTCKHSQTPNILKVV